MMVDCFETADHARAMEEAAENSDHDFETDGYEDPDDEDDLDEEDDDDADWEDYDEEMAHRAWQEELFFPEPEDSWA